MKKISFYNVYPYFNTTLNKKEESLFDKICDYINKISDNKNISVETNNIIFKTDGFVVKQIKPLTDVCSKERMFLTFVKNLDFTLTIKIKNEVICDFWVNVDVYGNITFEYKYLDYNLSNSVKRKVESLMILNEHKIQQIKDFIIYELNK